MDESRLAVSTHAFLRIEHESADPSEVTAVLGIVPTISQATANAGNAMTGPHGKVWVLASPCSVNSRDVMDHFKWLIDAIGPRGPQLKMLRERGYQMKIYCLWIGRKGGYGGPRLTPDLIGALAKLEVEVWFDVGFLEAPAGR
jgi:hypothetical protein